jgi:hypothetical protein
LHQNNIKQFILKFTFTQKKTLEQDDVTPLGDVLALEQVVGEDVEVIGAS